MRSMWQSHSHETDMPSSSNNTSSNFHQHIYVNIRNATQSFKQIISQAKQIDIHISTYTKLTLLKHDWNTLKITVTTDGSTA